jgi:crotonobetainyl-CoA:carnitine CoA-transferase CaiB-like acyl-CoA transferase
MNGDKAGGPCGGLRVLEFATMVAGPFAGQMLADLGAEVIKIEPTTGDPMRRGHPQHHGLSAGFSLFNRNKRSIGIDLKSPEGMALARELALTADVLIENFRPGVMDKLGLGHEALCRGNPKLIYASINGFGADGPYAARPAYDHVVQALSGTMPGIGSQDDPQPVRNSIVDKITAATSAQAILAALVHRERSNGRGQKVSVSLLDAYAAFMLPDLMANHYFQTPGVDASALPNTYFPVRTADGHVMGYVYTDEQFAGLCRMFDRTDLLVDPRFSGVKERRTHSEALWGEIRRSARSVSTAVIEKLAEAHSVPLGRVNDLPGFFADPQVQHNGTYFDHDDPLLGKVRQLRCPMRFEETPAVYRRRAPLLGEDARELLASLGRTEGEIESILENRVVTGSSPARAGSVGEQIAEVSA